VKTTNYYNTFIEVADDCPVGRAETPPQGASPSAAAIQYEMIAGAPYTYTSDDVVFRVHQLKHALPEQALIDKRAAFFAKGQPCMRGSALSKRYGWGVHSDDEGKVALYARESERYAQLSSDPQITHLKAFRNKRG
jgi:hypothetical protein